jgi:hypothetical protein
MEEAQGSGARSMSLRVLGSNTSARLLYEVGANQILRACDRIPHRGFAPSDTTGEGQ